MTAAKTNTTENTTFPPRLNQACEIKGHETKSLSQPLTYLYFKTNILRVSQVPMISFCKLVARAINPWLSNLSVPCETNGVKLRGV